MSLLYVTVCGVLESRLGLISYQPKAPRPWGRVSALGSTLWAVRAGSTGGGSSGGSTGDLLFAVAWGADFGGDGGRGSQSFTF
jgi:hypothetical protein